MVRNREDAQPRAVVAGYCNEDHYCRIYQQTVSISRHFMTSEAGQFETSEIGHDELIHLTNVVGRDEYHLCNQMTFYRNAFSIKEFHRRPLEERNPKFGICTFFQSSP